MKYLFVFICFVVFISTNSCVKYVDRYVEVPAKPPTDSSGCTSSSDIKICFTKTKPCLLDAEEFTFTCSGTDVPNDAKLEWYFGDGENYIGNKFLVKHSFRYANSYSVLLKVKTKDEKDIGEKTINVFAWGQNMKPRVSFEWYPDNLIGTSATYLFQSTYYGGAGSCKYDWSFGDEQKGEGKKIFHTYTLKSTPQKIYITLTMTSSAGCSASIKDSITLPAGFIINDSLKYIKTDPCLTFGEEYTFTAPQRNYDSNTLYIWDFGDGDNGIVTKVPTIKKRYSTPNIYKTTVVIKNGSLTYFTGSVPVYAKGQVVIPYANFSIHKDYENDSEIKYSFNQTQSPLAGFTVDYFDWNLGESIVFTNSFSAFQEKVYKKQSQLQSIPITLKVTSTSGCSDTKITTIEIPKL